MCSPRWRRKEMEYLSICLEYLSICLDFRWPEPLQPGAE